METLYVKDGYEYYRNADGRIVDRLCDQTLDYRVGELRPEVVAELDKARAMYRYPTTALVDTVIAYQEQSPEKAVNFIRYRLLGAASHVEVFGHAAEARYKAQAMEKRLQQHAWQTDRMEKKIDDLQKRIVELQNTVLKVLSNTAMKQNKAV